MSSPAAIRRKQRRRHFSQPRRTLRGHARISRRLHRFARRRERSTSAASISASKTAACCSRRCKSRDPPLYFGGSSEAAVDVAADTIDKYLTWGEPPAQVAEKIAPVAALAAKRGRQLSFGIRLHVIVRETNAEAWKAAEDLDRTRQRRNHRQRANDFRAHGFGRSKTHDAAARRTPRQARDQPKPLGRRRPGARRRRHRAGRRSADGRRAYEGISSRSASIPSSCRATPISKKPTGSPSWCFRCCP